MAVANFTVLFCNISHIQISYFCRVLKTAFHIFEVCAKFLQGTLQTLFIYLFLESVFSLGSVNHLRRGAGTSDSLPHCLHSFLTLCIQQLMVVPFHPCDEGGAEQ